MSNPAIEVAVTARIDELTKNLKAAEAAVATTAQKIEGTLKQGGGFGQQLGTFAKDQFNKSIGGLANRAGPLLTGTITGLFKDAAQAVAANPNAGFEDILGSMAGNLKARVASLPIVGDIAIAIVDLINAAADEVDRQTDARIASQERRVGLLQKAANLAEQNRRQRFAQSEDANDPRKAFEERKRQIEQERILEIGASGGIAELKKQIEDKAQLDLQKARQDAAKQQAALDKEVADKKKAAFEKAQRAAEEAAKAEAERMKQAADDQIAQIEAAADARSDAIDKELAAIEQVNSKADQRSALLQEGAANLVGSIDTAFGEFKTAQPGAERELVASVDKQIAQNERIAQLQAEQKRLAEETKASIDEIKRSLKGTVR